MRVEPLGIWTREDKIGFEADFWLLEDDNVAQQVQIVFLEI